MWRSPLRNPEQPGLADFIRHAERFGSELVYETALDCLHDPHELGLLSLALQRMDRRWQLAPAQRIALARKLLSARLPLIRICDMAQLSRTTLYRLRRDANGIAATSKRPRKARNHAAWMLQIRPHRSLVPTPPR
jgi:hypothetical protein